MAERCRELEPLHSAWLDDELPREARASVTAHLAGCDGCRRTVEGLRVTRSLLRSAPVRRLPPRLSGARIRVRSRAPVIVGRVAVSAAVAAAFVSGAGYALGTAPPPDAGVVRVPMEVYLADHLLQSSGSAIATPVLVEEQP